MPLISEFWCTKNNIKTNIFFEDKRLFGGFKNYIQIQLKLKSFKEFFVKK